MTPDALSKAAAIMIAARDAGGEFGRLPEDVRPITAEDGYAIQDEVIRQRAASGQALAGWKIGCTVKVMQEMLGLDGPSSGAVLALNTLNTPARIAAAGLTNPVAECEIAVRMASDVPSRRSARRSPPSATSPSKPSPARRRRSTTYTGPSRRTRLTSKPTGSP
ncbi:MAG: hypothetical protein HN577_19505 [Rhodospirillaceae bacterium]|nr:hypothetical protein [Rhodospirillaceae bacterium]